MSRGALDLSIGTLVVIILGLFILGAGIVLVWMIVDEGSAASSGLASEHRAQLRDMLSQGQLVAVWPASQYAQPGEDVTYGLAIENRLSYEEEFGVSHAVFDSQNNQIGDWMVLYAEPVTIKSNQQQELPVIVQPSESAALGDYTVIMTVATDRGVYDSKRFFTVRVE